MTFRTKLLGAMMLIVFAITALGLFLAQRQLTENAAQGLEREFQAQVALLHRIQAIHHAALAERCRVLAQKPRIHAALEDNGLDLLYPNARDELRDLMNRESHDSGETPSSTLFTTFYRFLDGTGTVIRPQDAVAVGKLTPDEEAELTLGKLPDQPQTGYLIRHGNENGHDETIDVVIAMPIISTETGQPIAAIVVGVRPIEPGPNLRARNIESGIWLKGQLFLTSRANFQPSPMLNSELSRVINLPNKAEKTLKIETEGHPYFVLYKQLNPNSLFPPAYEICLYPLEGLQVRQRQLRWQILGAGFLLLLGAFAISHVASARLSVPVTKLVEESAEARAEQERAEAALERTSKELQRAARFSANTSHQLKTPITVLRAGLEELRSHENLSPEGREEIAALIHQTFRITSIIEDLLLLSQMDAGRLQIAFSPVNLTDLIAAQLDDLSALSNDVTVEVEGCDHEIYVAGEQHYLALILQNLLENARKYNRPGGRIRISCQQADGWAVLTIGNTGRSIPGSAREHIFERFHRGPVEEEIPGHGLGLNLARELVRLHGGELRLVRSEGDWTEFEVRFRLTSQMAQTVHG